MYPAPIEWIIAPSDWKCSCRQKIWFFPWWFLQVEALHYTKHQDENVWQLRIQVRMNVKIQDIRKSLPIYHHQWEVDYKDIEKAVSLKRSSREWVISRPYQNDQTAGIYPKPCPIPLLSGKWRKLTMICTHPTEKSETELQTHSSGNLLK